MKGAFQDRQNCYLLMDYLDGGDLRYYINRNYSFSEEQTRTLSSISRVSNTMPRGRIEPSPSEEYHSPRHQAREHHTRSERICQDHWFGHCQVLEVVELTRDKWYSRLYGSRGSPQAKSFLLCWSICGWRDSLRTYCRQKALCGEGQEDDKGWDDIQGG